MFKKVGAAVCAIAPLSSFAAGPDYTTLTTAVDFGTTTAAMLSVAALLMVLYVSWKGAKLILHAVKGG